MALKQDFIVQSGLVALNTATIKSTGNASSTNTGALTVAGGVGIGSDLWVGGNSNIAGTLKLTNPTNAGSTTTGALVVTGGVGIGSNLYVGGSTLFQGPVTFAGTATYVLSTNTYYTDNIIELHTPPSGVYGSWTVDDGKDIGFRFHYYGSGADQNAALVLTDDTKYLEWYDTGAEASNGVFSTATYGTFKTGSIILANTTASVSTATGALQVQGGVGIGQDLWVGGTIHGNISGTITTATTVLVNNVSSNTTYYVALADNKNADANLDADTALTYDTTNGMLVVPNTSATSISVVNNVQIGGTVTITGGQGYVTILSFNGVSFLSNSVTGFIGGEVITPQSNGLGLSVGTIYYVKAVLSPTRFILSLTPTGSPVGSVGTQTITGTVGTAPGLQVTANLTSTSTTTGGLVVVGGVGIGGDLNVGGRIIGGGVRTNSSSTPPSYPAPTVGDIWYNSTNDAIYRYTADGAGQSYWLDITGPVVYTTI